MPVVVYKIIMRSGGVFQRPVSGTYASIWYSTTIARKNNPVIVMQLFIPFYTNDES